MSFFRHILLVAFGLCGVMTLSMLGQQNLPLDGLDRSTSTNPAPAAPRLRLEPTRLEPAKLDPPPAPTVPSPSTVSPSSETTPTPTPTLKEDPAPESAVLNIPRSPSLKVPIEMVSPGYVIKSGDLIRFKVLDEDDMDLNLRVGKDGTVNIPYINAAKIGGKTVKEAIEEIRKALLEYYISPVVSVEVIEFTRYEFSISGQVNNPGNFQIPSQQDTIGLMEAINMAGGTTRLGDLGNISIKRITNGQEEVISVDGRPIARNEPGAKFDIHAGDTIRVSLSNNQYVMMGEVKSPGMYELPPLADSIDLIQALAMAGGIGAGDIGEVSVKRKIQGVEQIIKLDQKTLRAMSRNQTSDHFFIHPGDTVAVKMAPTEFTILGQVRTPGRYKIDPLEDSISILEALAMAGGATRLGDLGHVLIRRMIDGKESALTVNAKEMTTDSNKEIIKIYPGDTVMVRERFF